MISTEYQHYLNSIKRLIFLLFTIFIASNDLKGQQNQNSTYLNLFDKIVGIENTDLYDGVAYIETHRIINEKTKFFKSIDFLEGSVTYNDQPYYNMKMKYDTFEDQVIIKLEDRRGGGSLKLFKDKISDFTIDGHTFIKMEPKADYPEILGFYEVLFKNNSFTLLTKHEKQEFLRKDGRLLYSEFVYQKRQNVVIIDDRPYVINNKRNLAELFPKYKKSIYKFYSIAKKLEKEDPDRFMVSLMVRIETLLDNE